MRHLMLILPLISCNGGSDTDPAETDTDTDTDDQRTIDNCEGTVGDDVPDFFKKYFHCVDIEMVGTDSVKITTEGLPPHASYYWGEGDPNYAEFNYDRGSDYHPNPNSLSAQNVSYTIELDPTSRGLTIASSMVDTVANTDSNEYKMGPAGVAIDSVMIFNDQAGPGDDINDEKFTFDDYNGHPANAGDYHYHTETEGPLEVMQAIGEGDAELYGMMCDGALVLGCTELDGSTPSTGDFDAQNGHSGDISDGTTTYFTGRYHTHVCATYTEHLFTPEIQFYSDCNVAQ